MFGAGLHLGRAKPRGAFGSVRQLRSKPEHHFRVHLGSEATLNVFPEALSSALGSGATLKPFPEAPAAPSKPIATSRRLWGCRASRKSDFERPYNLFEAKMELGPPNRPSAPRPRAEI